MPAALQRILIAPSGFKESLDAATVARAIAAGVRRGMPGVVVKTVPIADGGEGTVDTLLEATGGRRIEKWVKGPVGEPVHAHYGLLSGPGEGTAVIEMAAAAGLRHVPQDMRDPGATTTYGVGELIADAIEHGVNDILLGCGDSGTSDGGMGALKALGVRVLDADGSQVPDGGAHLVDVAILDLRDLHPAIRDGGVRITLALNPHNVMTGERGVARVFGPQKGATPEQVEQLAHGFDNWADVLARHCLDSAKETDFASGLGTGASGGLGAGMAAIGAHLVSRFEAILDSGLAGIDLDRLVKGADLVITAEGAIDFQTPKGKVPAEVARRASNHGVPVVGLAGTLGQGASAVHEIGIDAVASIVAVPMSLEDAVEEGESLLTDAAERMIRTLALGIVMADARRDDW